MPLLSSLLFGLVASLDAFLVGMTYGIRDIRINLRHNLLISLITLLGTCLSVLLGTRLLPLLPVSIAKIAGSSILILLGLYYLLKSMMSNRKKYLQTEAICDCQANEAVMNSSQENTNNVIQTTDWDNSTATSYDIITAPSLTLAEACILGITLSLNNMGIGLSASITGLPLLPTSVVTLLFSIAFLMGGNRLGCCRLLQLTKKAADPVSGLLLIVLGICQLVI